MKAVIRDFCWKPLHLEFVVVCFSNVLIALFLKTHIAINQEEKVENFAHTKYSFITSRHFCFQLFSLVFKKCLKFDSKEVQLARKKRNHIKRALEDKNL